MDSLSKTATVATTVNVICFIQENAFENVIWKMEAILAWPLYINSLGPRLLVDSGSNLKVLFSTYTVTD